MVLKYSIIVFITQVIFIGARTWNVKAIAAKNIPHVLISGTVVHIAWLVSMSIGVVSMQEVITKFEWQYIPVILASISGVLIGGYVSMKSKRF
jgi:hypothetical protein